MSLPYGLLGLLKYQDNTGYDLAKMFAASLNNFWHAQPSQIYRELNRLEEKGWVTSRSVIQNDRPNKNVFSITPQGLQALNAWANSNSPLFETTHDPMLIRLFFGANAPEATLIMLKTYRDSSLAALPKQTEAIQASIEKYEAAIPGGNNESPYWQMTLDYGIIQAKANIQWVQACIEKLEKQLKK